MILMVFAVILASALIFVACAPQMGAAVDGERLQRVRQSAQFRDGKFHNLTPTRVSSSNEGMFKTTWKFFVGGENREPERRLPTVQMATETLPQTQGLRVTWLGHSTCLIEIDGQMILTDPMFSDRASPISCMGPKRFDATQPVRIDDLPFMDVVLISHDHYDHLDYASIRQLHPKVGRFLVPLGVGTHLEKWGVDPDKITELDWWDEVDEGPLHFAATPARHFSGRGLTDGNKTLWASWVIAGAQHRVFFGGDSGYFNGFKQIGYVYGPFDITLLESGAYNEAWSEIHMLPEETVQAHRDLVGKVLLPIHWAKFNLALHSWTEPIERLTAEARFQGVQVATPQIGQPVVMGQPLPEQPWWEAVAPIQKGADQPQI